nr:cytosolic carboxypeptidase 2-like [Biomphalaria glabrata]
MSGSLTSSQETESTTSIATSSSDSDSTTVYSSSSSSSDSSWLDYEYAAYIFVMLQSKKIWTYIMMQQTSRGSAENYTAYIQLWRVRKMVPRLREPRSLYALNKELGPQQAARWPADLQVINERIKHIQTIPTEPEPFYKQSKHDFIHKSH